jgi:hypothetical protein
MSKCSINRKFTVMTSSSSSGAPGTDSTGVGMVYTQPGKMSLYSNPLSTIRQHYYHNSKPDKNFQNEEEDVGLIHTTQETIYEEPVTNKKLFTTSSGFLNLNRPYHIGRDSDPDLDNDAEEASYNDEQEYAQPQLQAPVYAKVSKCDEPVIHYCQFTPSRLHLRRRFRALHLV